MASVTGIEKPMPSEPPERELDTVRAADDVVVREHVAVGRNDHAGAKARGALRRQALRQVRKTAPQHLRGFGVAIDYRRRLREPPEGCAVRSIL